MTVGSASGMAAMASATALTKIVSHAWPLIPAQGDHHNYRESRCASDP